MKHAMENIHSSTGSLHVVLVATRNPLNIGAVARAITNFGFSSLRLVNPYKVAFREAKSAVGASELLRTCQEYPTLAEAIADCTLVIGTTSAQSRKIVHPLCGLDQAASLARSELRLGQVAVLFGSEKRGLSNEDLSLCHWLMRIPTCERHPSMNLGQAVAVCLYELGRDANDSMVMSPLPRATSVEVERLLNLLLQSLQVSGYARPTDISLERKVRRLLTRMNLSSLDLQLWSGMLRQILWKIKH